MRAFLESRLADLESAIANCHTPAFVRERLLRRHGVLLAALEGLPVPIPTVPHTRSLAS